MVKQAQANGIQKFLDISTTTDGCILVVDQKTSDLIKYD